MKNNCKVLDSKTQNFSTKKSFKYLAKSEDVNKKNVKENTVGVEIKISFIFITIYYHHRVLITIHTRNKISIDLLVTTIKRKIFNVSEDGYNNATEVHYSVSFILL